MQSLTVSLTGGLPAMVVLAAVLAFPAAILLLYLYRKKVIGAMRARAGGAVRGAQPAATAHGSPPQIRVTVLNPASPLAAGPAVSIHREAARAPWRLAMAYAIACAAYAAVMTSSMLIANRMEFLPFRFLMLSWVYAWPAVACIALVACGTARAMAFTAGAYFVGLAALAQVIAIRSPGFNIWQALVLWTVENLAPTCLLLAFLNRRVRAVGPLVAAFALIAATGANLAISIAGASDANLRRVVDAGTSVGLGATSILIALLALGAIILGIGGWIALRWIGRKYRARTITDQSLTLDSVMAMFGLAHAIPFVFAHAAWLLAGAAGFAVYKLVLRATVPLARRSGPPRDLLVLRVFALGKRSERLFDALARRWRHIGNIRLIAGPDLAVATVEPHEFLEFVSGRLDRMFIESAAAVEERLAPAAQTRDWDGRFRVHDFFCRDDTWRAALTRLAQTCDAVAMDLRGFSRENAGCIFEISELVNTVPLRKVVFVVDDATDMPFWRQTLDGALVRMRVESPNAAGPLETTIYRFADADRRSADRLIAALSAAAAPPQRAMAGAA